MITLTREEAQQVLDALRGDSMYAARQARETIRARLAQPEPEPVAWCIIENDRVHGLVKSKPAVMNAEKWQPLYTAPPQREWVGLTDDEKQYFRKLGLVGVEIIEAKLKEKNT